MDNGVFGRAAEGFRKEAEELIVFNMKIFVKILARYFPSLITTTIFENFTIITPEALNDPRSNFLLETGQMNLKKYTIINIITIMTIKIIKNHNQKTSYPTDMDQRVFVLKGVCTPKLVYVFK
ncbi:hypothetical protein DUI87_07065 [Hirundo rustica rustica]|uniref:Uncharacterized protein n=1 Tax=Hirundo rustica rustica TaxID=333673 RepID=A0A3M0KNR2_HIRRU|nr:hypothetical protein DUI87_07065 [Hirundo rustica rustica]